MGERGAYVLRTRTWPEGGWTSSPGWGRAGIGGEDEGPPGEEEEESHTTSDGILPFDGVEEVRLFPGGRGLGTSGQKSRPRWSSDGDLV